MKEHIFKRAKQETKHAILYTLLSGVAAIIDCSMFLILTSLGLPIIISNIISELCGLITSFTLNLKKNFKKNDNVNKRFLSYLIVTISGIIISTGIVYSLVHGANISKFASKLIQILIMAIPLYGANRFFTFGDIFKWQESNKYSDQYSNIKLPSDGVYKQAKRLLEEGKLVVFPTETIYGLGADARNDKAVLSIFELKGRPQDNPLITHLGFKEQIKDYATVENEIQQIIINKLMPGPLTLLLKKKEGTISNRSCPLDYVGIRLPSNTVAQKFLQVAELPVAAPSANISGKPSPTNAKMVYDNLHDNVPLIIDDGESFAGIESSVMRVVPDEEKAGKLKIQILRPGFLTKEDLEDCFNHEIKVEYTTKNPELSPGMRYKHYSISGHVRIFDNIFDIPNLSKEFSSQDTKIGILLTQELIDHNDNIINQLTKDGITIIPRGTKSNLASCAHSLFDHYHTAEKSGINLLFVEKLPEEGIGYGIMNRVKRSAEV